MVLHEMLLLQPLIWLTLLKMSTMQGGILLIRSGNGGFVDVILGDKLVKDKIWSILLDKNSTLVSPSLVTTITPFLPVFMFSISLK